jgi:hypothetical protein
MTDSENPKIGKKTVSMEKSGVFLEKEDELKYYS